MNIPVIGEYFLIEGFNGFIISGNKEKDITSFAKANNISQSEANKIFNSIPALKNFTQYLNTKETEENIIITDDNLDDNNPNLMTSVKTAGTATTDIQNNTFNPEDLINAIPTGQNASLNIELSGNILKITANDYYLSFNNIPDSLFNKLKVQIFGKNLTFVASKGIKSIINCASDSKIFGSSGKDYIVNNGDNVEIDSGSDDDEIINNGSNTNIFGGSGDDNIVNNSNDVNIVAGGGDDRVVNNGKNSNIFLGNGDDNFINNAENVFVKGNSGDDYIINNAILSKATDEDDNFFINNGTLKDTTQEPASPEPPMIPDISSHINDTIPASDTISENYTIPEEDTISGNDTISENDTISATETEKINTQLELVNNKLNEINTQITNIENQMIIAFENDNITEVAKYYETLKNLALVEKEYALQYAELIAQQNGKTLSNEEKNIISTVYNSEYSIYENENKLFNLQIEMDKLYSDLGKTTTNSEKEIIKNQIYLLEYKQQCYSKEISLNNKLYNASTYLYELITSNKFKNLSQENQKEFLQLTDNYITLNNKLVEKYSEYLDKCREGKLSEAEVNTFFTNEVESTKTAVQISADTLNAKIEELGLETDDTQNNNTTVNSNAGTLTLKAGETKTVTFDGITYEIGYTGTEESGSVEYSIKDGVLSIKGDNITFEIKNISDGKQPPKINFEGNYSIIKTFNDTNSSVQFDDIVNIVGWNNEIYVYGGNDKITSDAGSNGGNSYDFGTGNDELWLKGGTFQENEGGTFGMSELIYILNEWKSLGTKNIYWFNNDNNITSLIISPDGNVITRDTNKNEDGSISQSETIYENYLEKSGFENKKDANGDITYIYNYEYSYDNDDNMIGYFQKEENKTASTSVTIDQKYNADGNIISYDYKFANSITNEKYTTDISFEYDKSGQLISGTKKTDTDGNGIFDTTENLTNDVKYLSNKLGQTLLLNRGTELTDRIKNDINIVKNAEKSDNYDKAIKDALIKDYTSYTFNTSSKTSDIPSTELNKIAEGTIIEIKNEKDEKIICVKENNELVPLNISADTYIELFPPISRYDVNQGTIGDCYFISGSLLDMIKNTTTFAKLLEQFKENDDGSISFTFKGLKDEYGKEITVTFDRNSSGEIILKTLDGDFDGDGTIDTQWGVPETQVNASIGIQMLEQGYAISKFSNDESVDIKDIDIDNAINYIGQGGYQSDVYKDILGLDAIRFFDISDEVADYWAETGETILDEEKLQISSETLITGLSDEINNGQILFSMDFFKANLNYDIQENHAYSVEKIDVENRTIYLTNPWYGGSTIAVPFDEIINLSKSFNIANVDGSKVDINKLIGNNANSSAKSTVSKLQKRIISPSVNLNKTDNFFNKIRISELEKEINNLENEIKENPEKLMTKNILKIKKTQLNSLKK